ncbi:MAG: hypothetical protein II141_11460 [Clostridia bacterium]|nr:hypothetical protein [Clostridia bacterium]MBQ9290721.1 hypothetical protein [Clostridia bacterium]MBR0217236.1 hypothetical protein [Clostridia bacterium]
MTAKNLLLLFLLVICLIGFARAVPSGTITEEAQEQYLDEGIDEEYDFL